MFMWILIAILVVLALVWSMDMESSFGMRHLIVFLLFVATTVSYATRVSMSVAIVAMTTDNDYGHPVFKWERSVQDTILSSFFWGYILLQIPAGLLTSRFGGKVFITVAMLVTGLVNLVTPFAATKGDWMAVCACRILMGLSQGLLYPSLHGLLGQWAPAAERSRMGTFVYAGAQLGTIIEMMLAGVLSAGPWGWPAVFYVAVYILSFVFSWTADFLVNRNIISLPTARKLFNTIAFWGPAAALLGLSYIPAGHLTLAVVILTLTVGLNGAHYVGFLISHIDLSPNFASTLMGITNGCGNIFSIMAPLSVSLVVKDESSASEWRNVFLISIAFYFLSNLFFILFMSGKVQDWNEPQAAKTLEDGVKEVEEVDSSNKNKTMVEKF
ncbi:PREDICTED: putative inorganic phosphate cotransporter [Papilio polytes]|uniref:putative inorganic phosphate cotransporter n=1 Tax=Papilio polytes TaxID=76194 RepID=UPI0006761905|nr:PREDICTED: putative inorganic phosphate cotransporter [Papilio polytes]